MCLPGRNHRGAAVSLQNSNSSAHAPKKTGSRPPDSQADRCRSSSCLRPGVRSAHSLHFELMHTSMIRPQCRLWLIVVTVQPTPPKKQATDRLTGRLPAAEAAPV